MRASKMKRRRLLAALVLAGAVLGHAQAQDAGPAWSQLNPAQRGALAPLQGDWAGMNADNKEKWLEVAGRFPSMNAETRSRVQARMGEWARMTPDQRTRARLNFQELRQLPAEERQARWQAYQALPPERRKELTERAAPPRSAPPGESRESGDDRRPSPAEGRARGRGDAGIPPPPRTVSPSTVQAPSGATTTLMSRQANPPAHAQPGLPKIAATPGFVDRSTLLPQRRPQGAGVNPGPPESPQQGKHQKGGKGGKHP